FRQERCGKNGKVFKLFKFRSMYDDAEKLSGPVWSQKNDPRVTRVGKFIRKIRLDELPQMINVLKGEMSLVGPRPERPFFVEKLAEEIPYYKRRLKVKPGITGWAQVKHKYDESVEDVKTKLRFDLFYIENMSLRMDFKILFRTIFVVFLGKGHYD
ncbi:MAG: sugar transferase, partial [Ignavibacteriaceae bacterium]|nr:sugar transferase [Ignavibacteriaceae bacterium]